MSLLKKKILIVSLLCIFPFQSLFAAETHKNIEQEEPAVRGSIPLKSVKEEEYPQLVKISAQQAIASALRAVPGHIESVALENENNFLVYAIDVLAVRAGTKEVLIDAGTGHILSVQIEKHEISEENENE